MNNNFLALVLNYENYSETIKCVENLVRTTKLKKIVILENGSKNNSFDQMHDYFNEYNNIEVLDLKTNLGYASGFNYGLNAINTDEYDGVILVTSDTRVVSANLSFDFPSNVAVIGPQIVDSNFDKCSFPLKAVNLKYLLVTYTNIYVLEVCVRVKNYFSKLSSTRSNAEKNCEINTTERVFHENVYMVHGCWLILTKEFFRKFKEIPCPTFLYAEEDFIAYSCAKENTPIVWTNQVVVQHHGQRSTKSTNNVFSWRRRLQRKAQKQLLREINFWQLLKFWLNDQKD